MSEAPSLSFAGRVVLVTGASKGLGLATARWFAERGASVAGVGTSAGVEDAAASWPVVVEGQEHLAIRADVSSSGAPAEILRCAAEAIGTPDTLVNCAGISLRAPAASLAAEDWSRTMAVNLTAAFRLAQTAAPAMLAGGFGRIVNVSSQASVVALDEHVAYTASKAGMDGMTRALSLEWAPRGVTVNSVNPTIVNTAMAAEAWAGEKGEQARGEIPAGRFAEPEEVAAAIGYLASEEAAMVTGTCLMIDGGYTSV